jgi:hypothetical protein
MKVVRTLFRILIAGATISLFQTLAAAIFDQSTDATAHDPLGSGR